MSHEEKTKTELTKAKDSPNYVNNKEFVSAVVEYVAKVNQAKKDEKPIPIVPDYLAICFLKISEGLSHKHNFIRYTYREEMVMDGVETCLKGITMYDINAKTRTGSPNAFGYFTQICFWSFLRRIAKEKKQQDIKMKFMSECFIEDLVQFDDLDDFDYNANKPFLDHLLERINQVKNHDTQIKEFGKKIKKSKKEIPLSILQLFME
jgi:hypothetical protein